jgi:hypothetical protein
VDQNTRFRRLYRLDDGACLLAVASQTRPDDDAADDGNVEITFTTDAMSDVTLHWGIGSSKNKSWHMPPADIAPEKSVKDKGGVSLYGGSLLRHGAPRSMQNHVQ